MNELELLKSPYKDCLEKVEHIIRDSFPEQFIEKNPALYDVLELLGRGKKLRPLLVFLVGEMFGVSTNKLIPIAASLEIYHASTLIFDDIQDSSEKRRDLPCFYIKHGVPLGIAAGALTRSLMFKPIETSNDLTKDEKYAIYTFFNQTIVDLCQGQCQELGWHVQGRFDVSVDEYFQMTKRKTGSLFAVSMCIPSMLSKTGLSLVEKLNSLALEIGVIFQIRDDLLSLEIANDSLDKDLFADIQEGKMTLAVIHTLADETKSLELQAILNRKIKSLSDCKYYISLVEESGGIDFANTQAKQLMKSVVSSMKKHLPVEVNTDKFQSFLNFFIERRK